MAILPQLPQIRMLSLGHLAKVLSKFRDGHPLGIRLDVEFRRRAADVVLKHGGEKTTDDLTLLAQLPCKNGTGPNLEREALLLQPGALR